MGLCWVRVFVFGDKIYVMVINVLYVALLSCPMQWHTPPVFFSMVIYILYVAFLSCPVQWHTPPVFFSMAVNILCVACLQCYGTHLLCFSAWSLISCMLLFSAVQRYGIHLLCFSACHSFPLFCHSQIADAMAYMEKENFIHRNLGARNILVGVQNRVKVAGFGMTRTKDDPDFNFRRGEC